MDTEQSARTLQVLVADQSSSHDAAGAEIDLRNSGDEVEVRSRFDGRWTHGFTIAEVGDRAYQLRRRSDGSVLPAWFPAHMVRPTPDR